MTILKLFILVWMAATFYKMGQYSKRTRKSKTEIRLSKEKERQIKASEQREAKLVQAEAELAFNTEQRDRLFKLLDLEELERDASIENGKEWQKHQKKIISLENQIHTVQKRIDKAKIDKHLIDQLFIQLEERQSAS